MKSRSVHKADEPTRDINSRAKNNVLCNQNVFVPIIDPQHNLTIYTAANASACLGSTSANHAPIAGVGSTSGGTLDSIQEVKKNYACF